MVIIRKLLKVYDNTLEIPASNDNGIIIDFPADNNNASVKFKGKITGQAENVLLELTYFPNVSWSLFQ